MTSQQSIIIIIVVAMLAFSLFRTVMHLRRQRALAVPLRFEWLAFIEANIPPYQHLSEDLKQQLHSYIAEFLYDKQFEGCGGLELTDEIRVTIAVQACLLLLNRQVRCYPRLMSVVVYPSAYFAPDEEGEAEVRLGESWRHGTVVLAWDSVKHGALNFVDGHNLVIHEFAHQLDQEVKGLPVCCRNGSTTSTAVSRSTTAKEWHHPGPWIRRSSADHLRCRCLFGQREC